MDRIDFHPLLSSSSEDEERRPRVVKERNELLEELDDIEFRKRFRMNKETVQMLSNMLDGIAEPVDRRNQPISKINQILICLRFYATGSFQINVGDLFNVSQSTVSRIVSNVTRHIAQLRPNFIKMPDTDEQVRKTVSGFYNIAGFPGVIGTLDGTHVKIQSPGGNNAEVFKNRKNWFSINVQVIGNSQLKITDIVARWPGSVHDTTIFNDSHVRARLENNEFSPYYLLGDSGYPCRPYLLTPLINPITQPEMRYNEAHIRTRNTIERLIGVWKRRFPCISMGMRVKVQLICEIIVATAILHNICIEENDTGDDLIDDSPDGANVLNAVPQTPAREQDNTVMRTALITTIFN